MKVAVGVLAALAAAVPASAAEAPTLVVNPSVIGRVSAPLVFQGTIPGAGAGVEVKLEAKGCGETFFRLFGLTHTTAGGSWRWEPTGSGAYIRTNTQFRARARNAVSSTVTLRRRVYVGIEKRPRRMFRVGVVSEYVNLYGKRVRVERYTGARWVAFRNPKLVTKVGATYSAAFAVRQRGLQLRAVVPESLVKSCYAAGVSPMITS